MVVVCCVAVEADVFVSDGCSSAVFVDGASDSAEEKTTKSQVRIVRLIPLCGTQLKCGSVSRPISFQLAHARVTIELRNEIDSFICTSENLSNVVYSFWM